jgi:hypothetical protein
MNEFVRTKENKGESEGNLNKAHGAFFLISYQS